MPRNYETVELIKNTEQDNTSTEESTRKLNRGGWQ